MRMRWFCSAAIAGIVFLGGCAGNGTVPSELKPAEPAASSATKPAPLAKGETLAEARSGDYVLQLEASKSSYSKEEVVKLTARLKYEGELSEVTIGHAASPFLFLVKETKRDIDFGYAMDQPLIYRTLKKGEWFEETYAKNGGFTLTDDDPNAAFYREFKENAGFPEGEYGVYAAAEFLTYANGKPDEAGTNKSDARIVTSTLSFEVK